MRAVSAAIAGLSLLVGSVAWASANGMVAAWDFDETGSVVRDSSEHHIDGTIVGSVARVPGVDGGALQFSGDTSDFVEMKSKAPLDLSDRLSIEAWICRTDTGSRWDGIVTNGNPEQGYLVFYSEKTQSLTVYLNTDGEGFAPLVGAYVPLNEWMHIAVTFDSRDGRLALFQNGVKTAERSFKGRITGFPTEFMLGKAGNYQAFRGKLDRVRVYDRALSPDEIQAEYASIAKTLPAPAPAPQVLFENLRAEITGRDRVRVTFDKTNAFLRNAGRASDLDCTIVRTKHPRNDVNPGVRAGSVTARVRLRSADGKHYEYVDHLRLEPGMSYFYRVTAAPNPPDAFRVAPAKVRSYNPDIWWSVKKINARLDAIAAAYPKMAGIREIGKTVQGRPLRALFAGNPGRRIVIIGNMHVAESGPELILPAVEGILKEHPELLNRVGIAVLPCITLDERERMLNTGFPEYLRKNAHGVDMNRNFDGYREDALKVSTEDTCAGPSAASEPEVRAVMSLVEQPGVQAVFSFHSIASLCSADFLYTRYAEREHNTQYVERCQAIAAAYAEGMYGRDKDRYYTAAGIGSAGTLGSWAYRAHKIPSFDVELDKAETPRKYVYGDAVPLWLLEEYQVRHQRGIEHVLRLLDAPAS